MKIEFATLGLNIPINMIAACNRLIEIMEEKGTNNLKIVMPDPRIDAILWLLIQDVYGQFFNIESFSMYNQFSAELRKLSEENEAAQ